MNLILPLMSGFLGASAHVLSGPDHLAAVTPFAIEEKKSAWKVGIFWGIGHVTGMILIGIMFFVLKDLIPIHSISGYSEYLVGFVLIGIGLWAILKTTKYKLNKKVFHLHFNKYPYLHKHKSDSIEHDHDKENIPKKVLKNNFSAFSIGTIHGFAGIAHFLLFLPVLGFTSKIQITNYLIGFAIGTIIAMMIYAFLIGRISNLFHSSNKVLFKYLRIISGILAIIIGLHWIFEN